MPAGMQIIGGQNLDQDSKVMMMVSKINSTSMSMSTSGSGTYGRRSYSYTIPFGDCVCAVSLAPGSSNAPLMMTASSNGTTTSFTVSCHSSYTPTFDVYAFKQGGGGPVSSGAGIEIYRSDGSLGFGSAYKPMRPLLQFEHDPTSGGSSGGTYVGKRVACIFSKHARELDGTGSYVNMTTPTTAGHFLNNNSTGLCTIDMFVYNNIGKDLPYFAKNGRYMLVDVTNF